MPNRRRVLAWTKLASSQRTGRSPGDHERPYTGGSFVDNPISHNEKVRRRRAKILDAVRQRLLGETK